MSIEAADRLGPMSRGAHEIARPHLLEPPGDTAMFRYLGKQRRWVQVVLMATMVPPLCSLVLFSGRSVWLLTLIPIIFLNLLYFGVTVSTGLRRRRTSAHQHAATVVDWLARTRSVPSVDVFLPTCGEDLEVLQNTYRHVSALEWGAELAVWVLDDADRPEVADLAATYGFEYIVRPNRGQMKKAGNLLYAAGLSSGEVIAVLDADFCPRPDYLMQLVPYLQDPQVGIVQSPQYFQTTMSMTWLERGAAAIQEMFYRWVQPSRDAVGGAICVGTCALYRRSALDAAGGFVQIEHSEDVHTGIAVIRGGYEVRYVPVVASVGLCPDDMAAFVSQQYRWCTGSMSLLAQELRRAHRPLPISQRLCYWSGYLYYVSTAANIVLGHLPILVMILMYGPEIRPVHTVLFLPVVWAHMVLVPRVMRGRWRPDALRVGMAASFAHAVAIWHVVRGRSGAWTPTGTRGGSGATARSVAQLGIVVMTLVLGLGWAGMAALTSSGHGRHVWGIAVLFVGYSYVACPLWWSFLRVLVPSRREAPRRRTVVRTDEHSRERRLPLGDAVARTILVVFVGLLAVGVVDLSALDYYF